MESRYVVFNSCVVQCNADSGWCFPGHRCDRRGTSHLLSEDAVFHKLVQLLIEFEFKVIKVLLNSIEMSKLLELFFEIQNTINI